MYSIVFYLLYFMVMRLYRKRASISKTRGLCAGCSFAHIQYGTSAKTATFCTFGGGVRPVAIDVLYCTDYRDRHAAPRIVAIGFAREIASAEATAEAATSTW